MRLPDLSIVTDANTNALSGLLALTLSGACRTYLLCTFGSQDVHHAGYVPPPVNKSYVSKAHRATLRRELFDAESSTPG